MLPAILPLFPLPQVLLFPHTFQPLHIFEPRYRQLVTEVLVSHQHFILALARDPVTTDPRDKPAVFDVASLARIVRAEPLDDGRWNILVEGMGSHRILEEVGGKSYRQVRTEALPFDAGTPLRTGDRERLFATLNSYAGRHGIDGQVRELLELPLDLEAQLFTLSLALEFEPVEKQFLLESTTLPQLGERLNQLLDFALSDRGLHGEIH
ncbi:MAG TPA: LON peptidase substrate-binding domain-containing protein [Holophagaceae bacterium]|nr:LON peptidase substrate-binding domain-containing protein [Holophagaceae bacterium]